MRATLVVAAFLLSLAPALAQTPKIEMLEVVSSGFSGPGEKIVPGRVRRLVSRTPAVVAVPGTAFGITVRPVGEPKGAEVTLRWVWKAPRPGVKDKETGKLTRQVSQDAVATIGSLSERSWPFKEADNIVRGNWRVEVWNGSRRLAVRRFAIK
jgi:hypothetical protein